MSKHYIRLLPDHFYHLYSRAVGNEKLFRSNENYLYFLSKMKQHILPVADVFAYSLLPNHFHLLVRIKVAEALFDFYEKKKGKPFDILSGDIGLISNRPIRF